MFLCFSDVALFTFCMTYFLWFLLRLGFISIYLLSCVGGRFRSGPRPQEVITSGSESESPVYRASFCHAPFLLTGPVHTEARQRWEIVPEVRVLVVSIVMGLLVCPIG